MLREDEVLIREGIFELPSMPGESPKLFGSKCRSCGEILFPVKEFCPNCNTSEKLEKITFSGEAKLYSYSIVRAGTPEFSMPYTVGIIELKEGPLIISHLQDCDNESLYIGMNLSLSVGQISTNKEGKKVISYVFKPD